MQNLEQLLVGHFGRERGQLQHVPHAPYSTLVQVALDKSKRPIPGSLHLSLNTWTFLISSLRRICFLTWFSSFIFFWFSPRNRVKNIREEVIYRYFRIYKNKRVDGFNWNKNYVHTCNLPPRKTRNFWLRKSLLLGKETRTTPTPGKFYGLQILE